MQQPPNPYPQYPQQQWNPQQPTYPPQQYQQQPQYQPPKQPQKKNSRARFWLILVAVVFGLAVIIGLASRGQNPQPASTTQTTQQSTTQPTTRPTTQAPTQPPTKPTPQVSIQSQLQSTVQKSGAAYIGGATVTYDASAKYAHVFENFPVTGDNNLDVGRIKQDAFAIQKAIWQAHVSGVEAVQVLFDSDDVNNPLRLATCELESTTAVKLEWASITSDQAWSDYNDTWLSPNI